MKGITLDILVTTPHIVCAHSGCHSGSWGEPMGHVADVCQSAPHGDSGSYDSGDSEVKTTRQATGALHRPQRGSKTRSGTSSKGVAHRLAATSRVGPGAGTSRDGQRSSA
jgi:hypothetical protein